MSKPARTHPVDAIIIGSGPNGLAAAITLARRGWNVRVLEAHETPGGGTRTLDWTLPGYHHDACSAIQPLSLASPFFRSLPLDEFGVEWVQPPIDLAHPLDDGRVATVERSLEATAAGFGVDARSYRNLIGPLVCNWKKIMADFLGPLPFPPKYPFQMVRFGLSAIQSAAGLAHGIFKTEPTRAIFAGCAAHGMLPLDKPATAAFGLMLLTLAHAVGFQFPRGGAQSVCRAMVRYLESLGGVVQTNCLISDLEELPAAQAYIFDTSPLQLTRIAANRLPEGYLKQLKKYRYGPGVFKIDYALSGPVPWKAESCTRAGTIHLGGNLTEITASEKSVWQGNHPAKPYVLITQPSLFDPTRAPQGKHTLWVYCHVPNGSGTDMTGQIEALIEHHAPGFSSLILARHTLTANGMEVYNPNYVGGDINCGVQDLGQLFTRPVARISPYTTPDRQIFICSSATPPGGGVHGMCGYHAARAVLAGLS